MSNGPDKIGPIYDFLSGSGGAVTTTGAGTVVTLPPGKKAISVFTGTGIVATLVIQNSIDGTNWVNVATCATANTTNIFEVDSAVPKWRSNYTVMTTAATSTSAASAVITQQIL